MTKKEILLEQFDACCSENNWFVAAKGALANLTAEQANWKTENLDNSIREMVNHLSFWNERWLRRLRNEAIGDAPENDATFRDDAENDWQAAKEKLFRVLAEWRTALESIDENKLDETVSSDYAAVWALPIANMNVHNAYHIGQIVFIRKLQGAWSAEQGVS